MREAMTRHGSAMPWLLAGIAFVIYQAAAGGLGGPESHSLFAAAFLDGHLWIQTPADSLELAPGPVAGSWYSPFPPLPALTYVPFTALGVDPDTSILAAAAGAASVILVWLLLDESAARLPLTVAWAFGSEVLWVAGTGGQHLYPQILAAALLLGALVASRTGRPAALAGLLVGLAAMARLPVALALPLVAWPYDWRGRGAVLFGLAVPLAVMAVYNVARYDVPWEFGYGLIAYPDGTTVLDEPYYTNGIVALEYLPRGLTAALLRGFDSVEGWARPSFYGASILLTMPIVMWVVEARPIRWALVAGGTALLVLLPDLLHGNPGFGQFGYRFVLDALPIVWLMLGVALAARIPPAAWLALVFGIVVNIYGSLAFWAGRATMFGPSF